jgi:ATP synthase protein I
LISVSFGKTGAATKLLPSFAVVVGLARDRCTRNAIPENVMPIPDKPQNERKTALRELVQAESMVQIALVLPLSCIIGWALGDFLDHKLHQSWIAILGLGLGIAAGFIQVIRMAYHVNRSDENTTKTNDQ